MSPASLLGVFVLGVLSVMEQKVGSAARVDKDVARGALLMVKAEFVVSPLSPPQMAMENRGSNAGAKKGNPIKWSQCVWVTSKLMWDTLRSFISASPIFLMPDPASTAMH